MRRGYRGYIVPGLGPRGGMELGKPELPLLVPAKLMRPFSERTAT